MITDIQEWISIVWRLMCKNLEYISLLQSRATLAEPSKMHRNRPLAVHPATLSRIKNKLCENANYYLIKLIKFVYIKGLIKGKATKHISL
jgi:hypothetical protein